MFPSALVGLMIVVGVSQGWAQAIDGCHHLAWDHPGHPVLGAFHIYIKPVGERIRFTVKEGVLPTASVPAIPEMVREVLCTAIHLAKPGQYIAVVTAVSKDLQIESAPSNEIMLTARGSTLPPIPAAPQSPPSPRPPSPSTPIPPIVSAPPIVLPTIPLPPATSSGRRVTETCVWRGTCGGPSPYER